jgi:hypothetical protein
MTTIDGAFVYSLHVDASSGPHDTWSGARLTATIFFMLATLWFLSGAGLVYLTYRNGNTFGASSTDVAIVFEIVATLLGTALLAFFGYVLELLAGIWDLLAGIGDLLAGDDE